MPRKILVVHFAMSKTIDILCFEMKLDARGIGREASETRGIASRAGEVNAPAGDDDFPAPIGESSDAMIVRSCIPFHVTRTIRDGG
jgi:hypothetical protein